MKVFIFAKDENMMEVCALAHHLNLKCVPLYSGSAQRSVMGKMKWPATYTRYFALGM